MIKITLYIVKDEIYCSIWFDIEGQIIPLPLCDQTENKYTYHLRKHLKYKWIDGLLTIQSVINKC